MKFYRIAICLICNDMTMSWQFAAIFWYWNWKYKQWEWFWISWKSKRKTHNASIWSKNVIRHVFCLGNEAKTENITERWNIKMVKIARTIYKYNCKFTQNHFSKAAEKNNILFERKKKLSEKCTFIEMREHRLSDMKMFRFRFNEIQSVRECLRFWWHCHLRSGIQCVVTDTGFPFEIAFDRCTINIFPLNFVFFILFIFFVFFRKSDTRNR